MSKIRKGKILRVKLGYNPNSSSIGSIVFAVPSLLFVLAAFFGAATSVVFAKFLGKSDVNKMIKDEALSREPVE